MKFLVQPLSRLTLITFACIYRRERGGGGGAAQREEALEGEVTFFLGLCGNKNIEILN